MYESGREVIRGPQIVSGPILPSTTGGIAFRLPAVTQVMPLHSPTNTNDGVTLFGVLRVQSPYPQFAVDATANVIWYSTVVSQYPTRPVPGGTFLQVYGFTTDLAHSGLKETDLAGNLVKETTVERMN